jgi:hypothetical protein
LEEAGAGLSGIPCSLVLIHRDDHAAQQHILRLSTSSDLEKVSAGDKKQQYSFTTADNKYFDKKYATDAVTVRLNQDTLARTGPWSSPRANA